MSRNGRRSMRGRCSTAQSLTPTATHPPPALRFWVGRATHEWSDRGDSVPRSFAPAAPMSEHPFAVTSSSAPPSHGRACSRSGSHINLPRRHKEVLALSARTARRETLRLGGVRGVCPIGRMRVTWSDAASTALDGQCESHLMGLCDIDDLIACLRPRQDETAGNDRIGDDGREPAWTSVSTPSRTRG
jgi:hypothetical protein